MVVHTCHDFNERAEALKSALKAVNIRERLAAKNADAFEPDLASSLNNLGSFYSALDQRAEALESAHKAMKLYERLAAKNADAFEPDLAMSLNNLGGCYSDLGQRAEALESALKAVKIRERLAAKNADAFEPELATSFGVLGSIHLQNENAEEAIDFNQFRPEMGFVEKEHQKTIVKIAYNDDAIFVAAYLHDNPEDIMKQFTSRGNFGQSDFFGLILNTNNDAQNDIEFFVFSSGTQADAVSSPSNGKDFGWNAVWDSAVKIVDDGWIVEMKIPYSALRFSNQEVQTWGLQFHRRFRVSNSQYSWNPIDRTKGNIGL